MGNRKAMFASVFIVLLLGICLVPAFAEDNVAAGQDTNASMAADQLNESELVTNEAMSVDSASDSYVSDSTDTVKPEKPKSVYDLASGHVDDLAGEFCTFGSSVNSNFVLDVPCGTASADRKLQLYSGNKTNAQVWRVSHDQKALLSLLVSRVARLMPRAVTRAIEIPFSFGPITAPLRSAGSQLKIPMASTP